MRSNNRRRDRQAPEVEPPPLSDQAEVVAAVKHFLAQAPEPRAEWRDIGRAIMQKLFRMEGLEFSEQALEPVTEWFNFTNDDLYLAIGLGLFVAREVFRVILSPPPRDSNVALMPPFWTLRQKYYRESKKPGYTKGAPTSETAEPSAASGMRDFNIAVKEETEPLARALKEARSETLARLVDLNNPALAPDERLRRARRLVGNYRLRRAENPDFPASPEVRAAFSIINRHNYQRKKAKAAKAKLAM